MILIDTNVVSEPMKTRSDPRVVAWLDRQTPETLFVSTITVAEILFGVAALPAGRRRNRLGEAFEREVERLFEGRIMSFDLAAARAYAVLMSGARTKGPRSQWLMVRSRRSPRRTGYRSLPATKRRFAPRA